MIEFEIKPDYYNQICKAILAIEYECKLCFTKTGVKTDIVDPANVCMVSLDMPEKIFEDYHVTKNVQIGYNFDLYVTKKTKNNHKFNITQQDSDVVDRPITILNIEHDIFVDTMTLLDVESIRRKPKVPQLDLSCSFNIDVDFLKKIIKRDTHVVFDVVNSKLECYGVDKNWNTKPIEVNTIDTAHGNYSTDYLKDIVKAIPNKIKTIKMSMGIDYPCTIEFPICDGLVPVKYLLAPRIESE